MEIVPIQDQLPGDPADDHSRYLEAAVGGLLLCTLYLPNGKSFKEVPAKTPEWDAMGKDLKGRGFKFVGSTICYGFMQAVGMVNDHLVECFRHAQLSKNARKLK